MENNTQLPKTKCQFYMEGRCRFGDDCHNFHDPQIEAKPEIQSSLKKRKNLNHSKQGLSVGKESKVKPKMRTAIDVIHRIQWDDTMPEELITIGYEDRFTGIQVISISMN